MTNNNLAFNALCFIGGGAKGYVNPGAYKALHESGLMNDISTLTGASVGALTASLISVGITPDRLHQKLSEKSMKQLTGEGAMDINIPFLGKIDIPLLKDAAGLKQLLQETFREEVSGFLQENPDVSKLTPEEQDVIQSIKTKLNQADTVLDLKMSELAILRKLDDSKFRDLGVVAVESESQAIRQFT